MSEALHSVLVTIYAIYIEKKREQERESARDRVNSWTNSERGCERDCKLNLCWFYRIVLTCWWYELKMLFDKFWTGVDFFFFYLLSMNFTYCWNKQAQIEEYSYVYCPFNTCIVYPSLTRARTGFTSHSLWCSTGYWLFTRRLPIQHSIIS